MDIKNVILKQKRYSTYGWNKKSDTGEYLNTLKQGEIGVLLGSDGKDVVSPNTNLSLNSVLEVRIGSVDNQYFFDATLLSNGGSVSTDYCIKTFQTYSELPSFGKGSQNNLYIVKDENAIYRWDDDAYPNWIKISGHDWHEIKCIDGGSALGSDLI